MLRYTYFGCIVQNSIQALPELVGTFLKVRLKSKLCIRMMQYAHL